MLKSTTAANTSNNHRMSVFWITFSIIEGSFPAAATRLDSPLELETHAWGQGLPATHFFTRHPEMVGGC
jgi:hypothetical protein